MVLKLTGFVQKISTAQWDNRVLIDTSDDQLIAAVAQSHAALRQALADCVFHGSDGLTIDAAAALSHLDDMPILEEMQ
jgi:hypothetical protein